MLWERVGAAASPLTAAAQEAGAQGLPRLLFDESDVLAAIVARKPPEGDDVEGDGQSSQQAAAEHERRRRRAAASCRSRSGQRRGRGEAGESGSDGSSGEISDGSSGRSSSSGGRGTRGGRSPAPAAASADGEGGGLSLLSVVRAPRRVWLQSFFADLRADRRQVGLDDSLHPWFREQQVQHARRVAASGSAAACRAAARTGLPPSERAACWACALGLPPLPGVAKAEGAGDGSSGLGWAGPYKASARDEDVLQVLCEAVERQPLLVDALTCADVAEVCGGSQHYFPFADVTRLGLLAPC